MRLRLSTSRSSGSDRRGKLLDEAVTCIRYQVIGLGNIGVSTAVLNIFFLLSPPKTKEILILGNTTAYIAADINCFFWNARWTFRAGKGNFRQLVRFAPLCLVELFINAAILWGASGWLLSLRFPEWLIGNLSQFSMATTGIMGYAVCRMWVFQDICAKDLSRSASKEGQPGGFGRIFRHLHQETQRVLDHCALQKRHIRG